MGIFSFTFCWQAFVCFSCSAYGVVYISCKSPSMPDGNYHRRFRSLFVCPLLHVWRLSSAFNSLCVLVRCGLLSSLGRDVQGLRARPVDYNVSVNAAQAHQKTSFLNLFLNSRVFSSRVTETHTHSLSLYLSLSLPVSLSVHLSLLFDVFKSVFCEVILERPCWEITFLSLSTGIWEFRLIFN